MLCFSVDPQWGRVYFLLGKERHIVKWEAGSDRWSYFGGRPLSRQESVEHTAAREFHEETLGVVRYRPTDALPRRGYEDIVASLRAGEFAFKVTLWIPGDAGEDRQRCYVTYVKQIPWDPHALPRFQRARHSLSTLPRTIGDASSTFTSVQHGWALRHPAVVVARPSSLGTHNLPNTQEVGSAIVSRAQFMAALMTTSTSASSSLSSSQLAQSPARHRPSWSTFRTSIKNTPKRQQTSNTITSATVVPQLPNSVARNEQVSGHSGNQTGVGGVVSVNRDFLEKRCLGLWSIPQLQRAINSRGILSSRFGRPERCRTSFLQFAALVMNELALYEPTCMENAADAWAWGP